jgi:lipoprotein-anchoring transpeptidase ErfK/SrfK
MEDNPMLIDMRRLVGLLLFGVLLVLMAACSAGPVSDQASKILIGTPIAQDEIPAPVPSSTPAHSPAPSPAPAPDKPGVPPAPLPLGKVILVSLSQQWLYAYEDGRLVFDHAVETGRPELPTPSGTFSILEKARDVMFTSPWPEGSPHYYEPTHVNYALLFKEGGFFLHDAWWHEQFGPGSNVPHQLPDGSWETGSHGCVGMPIPDAERLYKWAPTGTPVIINDLPPATFMALAL